MSRDPYDDYTHDDPDRAARERGPTDHDDRGDSRTVAIARGAAAAPALFLILNGLFGLVCVALLSVPMIFQPEMIIKFGRDMAANQPAGPQRKDLEKQMDEAEQQLQQNRAIMQVENTIKLGILAVGNLIAILGGFAMRALRSYGLSMTGAIVSLIPVLTGCCGTGMPFGLWALIVLLRPEVKAGFAARRRAAQSPDRY